MNLAIKSFDELKKYQKCWVKMEHKNDILPFLTYEWVETWVEHFGKDKKLKIMISTDNDDINYLIPLVKSGFRYRFIGYNSSDYLDALLFKDFDGSILSNEISKFKVYDFEHIFDDSRLINITDKLDKVILSQDTCPYIDLTNDFDDYMSTLNKRFKKNFEYALRRINREFSVEFLEPKTHEDVENYMNALILFHQRRWRKKFMPGAFYSKKIRNFHIDAAKKMFDGGYLLLNALFLNGKVAGVIYGFKNDHTYYYYLSGFDDKYSYLSIGNLLVGLTVRQAFAGGIKVFDFLRGSEKYKYLWTQKDKILKRAIYYHKNLISLIIVKVLQADNDIIMKIKEKSEQ